MHVFLLLVIIFYISDIAMADESPDNSVRDVHPSKISASLDGKRLFFEVRERESTEELAIATANDVDLDGTDSEPDAVTQDHEVFGGAKKTRRNTSTHIAFRYDARIESDDYVQFIINGSLCDRIARKTHSSERLDGNIVCSFLESSAMQLQLSADEKHIRIVRNDVVVSVLKPGQEL